MHSLARGRRFGSAVPSVTGMTRIDQSRAAAASSAPIARLRAAWQAAHTPVAGVPRWARLAAYAVPLVVLPSGLWRLHVVFASGGLGEKVYVVCLSIVSELVAFTAVGLVAGWGERFPRWIPGLRGRTVPPMVAVIPATVAAAALTILWTAAFVTIFRGVTWDGEPLHPDFPTEGGFRESAVFYLCYLPLLLWGPLLGSATYAYHRRRRPVGRPARSAPS